VPEEKPAEHVISAEPEKLKGTPESSAARPPGRSLCAVGLAALGVVFGDIGTSPIYAFRKCFHDPGPLAASSENVLGVLSLIFWALMIAISVKYIAYVMASDNEGEGGILALMALIAPRRRARTVLEGAVLAIGLFGAALLYGDSMITPAISVLSAVEGLGVAARSLDAWVVPITIIILLFLFMFQKRGTQDVGAAFGPVMLVWFIAIAALGIVHILRQPSVLGAVNPIHAIRFFQVNGWLAFFLLGAVFLVVTGGEALYADIGHFGRKPIRTAWFAIVLPALILNYFGQGALVLSDPRAAGSPFYLLAPVWALYPLIVLATAATVIASQAVITAAFSLTRQGVLLAVLPRLRIVQTSRAKIGQIYIPTVNWLLMLAAIGLVLAFRRSANLAAAYGVAVSATMVITTLLAYVNSRRRRGWGLAPALLVTGAFLLVDLSFFAANLFKVRSGGWFPLLVAAGAFLVMSTWRDARLIAEEQSERESLSVGEFLRYVFEKNPPRVPGTAIFLTGDMTGTPVALRRNLEHNQVLHELVVLLTVRIEDRPRVGAAARREVEKIAEGFWRVILHFGFMEELDVPQAMKDPPLEATDLHLETATYFVGRQTLVRREWRPRMAIWRQRLSGFLARNAADAVSYYHIPPERVLELGLRDEI
jgi:KUP system potassium uptake protein